VAALLHENGNDSERYRQRSQDSHADTKEQIIPHGATISGLTPWGDVAVCAGRGRSQLSYPASATQPGWDRFSRNEWGQLRLHGANSSVGRFLAHVRFVPAACGHSSHAN
jgi:hypothetical protein